MDECVICRKDIEVGLSGNELGLCPDCQKLFDLDQYYQDYDNDKVIFKGFETLGRGILEPYRK